MQEFIPPETQAVQKILRDFVGQRVAVAGDLMLDVYLMGRIKRISPEAPVPVFEIEREERMLGGAANVAKCLVALGAKVKLCGIVGEDADGETLLKEAEGLGIDTSCIVRDASRPTTIKTRVVAQHQQMIRLDRETARPLSPAMERRVAEAAARAARWSEGLVLSDYSKGVLSSRVCSTAIKAAASRPVFADPKGGSWERFEGATLIKPNRRDAQAFTGKSITDDASAAEAAEAILRATSAANILVTRGEDGMTLVSAGAQCRTLHFPTHKLEVYDVTGAGDQVIAALSLAVVAGADLPTATWLANVAAGVKVGKFGAASVSEGEILDAAGKSAPDYERKVMSREQAAIFARDLRRRGKKVVFTNGCFDLLHFGHVSYLEKSRRLGDALIVGINSDASVRRLKGPGRPIKTEHDRARVMAALSGVDAVVVFGEDTPQKLIEAVRPDVLCKGADYKVKQKVVGWDLVEGWGGRVVLVDLVDGLSTTEILKAAAKRSNGAAE